MKRALDIILSCLILFAAGVMFMYFKDYKLNVTPSLPVGIWRILPRDPLKRGDYVTFSAKWDTIGISRGYHKRDTPFLKKIAGVSGDVISRDAEGHYSVNGETLENVVFRKQDGSGRAAPDKFKYPYTLQDGQYFLISNHLSGWDSRYFGPVPLHCIMGRAEPVLVWKQ